MLDGIEQAHQKLHRQFISLNTQWIATRQEWRDTVGDQFEKEHWDELEKGSERYLLALQKLIADFQQAEISTR